MFPAKQTARQAAAHQNPFGGAALDSYARDSPDPAREILSVLFVTQAARRTLEPGLAKFRRTGAQSHGDSLSGAAPGSCARDWRPW
jgi:hypothetical protein